MADTDYERLDVAARCGTLPASRPPAGASGRAARPSKGVRLDGVVVVRGYPGGHALYLGHLVIDGLRAAVAVAWGRELPRQRQCCRAATHPCIRELQVLDGLGHCPHDEAPERVNPILLGWLGDAAADHD